MLTQRDLEQIRAIVRDELERATRTRPSGEQATSSDEESTEPASQDEALAQWARADAHALRGEPGAARTARMLEARYRSRYDEGFQKRARRTLSMGPDAIVTEADMLRVMRFWDEANAARKAKRGKNKQRNDAAK